MAGRDRQTHGSGVNFFRQRIVFVPEYTGQGFLAVRRDRVVDFRHYVFSGQVCLEFIAVLMPYVINMVNINKVILDNRFDKIISQTLVIQGSRLPFVAVYSVKFSQFFIIISVC